MCEVVGTCIVTGLVASLLSLYAERRGGYLQSNPLAMAIVNHLLFATGCAAVVFAVRYADRNRRLRHQRLELMAASIEQIRQALQMIIDSAVAGTPQQRIVLYAVEHIEWVMKEALPAVNETPQQVRERMKKTGGAHQSVS